MIAATCMLLFCAAMETTGKAPWEWTIDERLAERFDPAKIHERESAYVTVHPQLRPALQSVSGPYLP